MKLFKLPDLGEGLHEAEIVRWHVAVGDKVRADQVLVTVETDKAVIEIVVPYEARVAELYAAVGQTVPIGAPLVGFGGEAEDTGTVVGELKHVVEPKREADVVKATPAVRALARRFGVDLAQVSGSGPEGTLLAADVVRAGKTPALATAEPLRGVRRAMATRMSLAHAEVASATIMDDADIECWPSDVPLLARLVRAIVAGTRAEPGVNAWFDRHTLSRRLFPAVHVGIAVDTADGLIVPVLRDCQDRELAPLRHALRQLVTAARSRTLATEDLRDHTITLSNYGAIAGRYAAPIVMPPTVAILGAGRIAPRVVVDRGTPAVHRILPLSLTFDHRALSGGEAGRFLRVVISDLERAD